MKLLLSLALALLMLPFLAVAQASLPVSPVLAAMLSPQMQQALLALGAVIGGIVGFCNAVGYALTSLAPPQSKWYALGRTILGGVHKADPILAMLPGPHYDSAAARQAAEIEAARQAGGAKPPAQSGQASLRMIFVLMLTALVVTACAHGILPGQGITGVEVGTVQGQPVTAGLQAGLVTGVPPACYEPVTVSVAGFGSLPVQCSTGNGQATCTFDLPVKPTPVSSAAGTVWTCQ